MKGLEFGSKVVANRKIEYADLTIKKGSKGIIVPHHLTPGLMKVKFSDKTIWVDLDYIKKQRGMKP